MYTSQLRRQLRRDEFVKPILLDVYAADQLPREKIAKDTWFLVCNCCPIRRPGEHWLAIFYENGHLDFFDSLGLSTMAYEGTIVEFLQRQQAQTLFYNNATLQSISSDACGHYCIVFGCLRARGQTMHAIVHDMLELSRDNFVKYIASVF